MNKKVVFTSCGILLSSLSFFVPAMAEGNGHFSLSVGSFLNLSLSTSDISLAVRPSSQGSFGSSNLTATASTNGAYGYALNLTIKDDTGSLNTDLVSDVPNVNTGDYPAISTLGVSGKLTAAQFAASTDAGVVNHWGISVDDTDQYESAKTSSTIKSTNSAIANDQTPIYLATKLDLLTSPGAYSATLNFEIVANIVVEP